MGITKSRNYFIEMVGNLFLMQIKVKKIASARIKKSIIYIKAMYDELRHFSICESYTILLSCLNIFLDF